MSGGYYIERDPDGGHFTIMAVSPGFKPMRISVAMMKERAEEILKRLLVTPAVHLEDR